MGLYPREIILETTNHCNLRCRFCHFHGEGVKKRRPKGFLSRRLFFRILEELSSWRPPHSITLCLHGAGEPLLHPELKDFLEAAVAVPHLRVGFMTNAMLLSEDWARFLVELPLAWIAFSVDGVRPETNDTFRRGARLQKIEKNISRLLAYKREKKSPLPEVSFNMVKYPGVSEEEVQAYVARWLPEAARVMVSRFRPIGSRRLLTPQERLCLSPRPCPLPFQQLVVGWDGQVGLCCEDPFLEIFLGDANNQRLLEIFSGPRLSRVRELISSLRLEALPLCRDCDVWAAEIPLKEEIIEIGGKKVRVIYRPSGRLFLP